VKKIIISAFVIFALVGCGSSDKVVQIDNNLTLPYDGNTTIESNSGVGNITFSEGSIYVSCLDGASCEIVLGDKSGDTDSSDNSNSSDNSDNSNNSDNSDNSNNSVYENYPISTVNEEQE